MNHSSESPHERIQIEGRYTNYFTVGHNAFEFLLDFGHCSPEDAEGQFHTRIITSPNCAKALLELFQAAVDEYEKTFGLIQGQRT